ncbi:MAG: hypothetical protein HQ582_32400 [Planctomycetes bacterium]|nr:hypothetical protein [Planctomycetota bacterium]
MSRPAMILPLLLAVAGVPSLAAESPGSGTPPLKYELMINGESFLVEANRQVKLESQEEAGVTYEVALRIALEQSVRLNTFQFEYDWPARVEDDRGEDQRTAGIQHELGYLMLITDLGHPLKADAKEAEEKAFAVIRDSTLQRFREAGMKEIAVTEYKSREFAGSLGRGAMIRYQDTQGADRTCLVYLMTGPSFTGYSTIEYLDADQHDVLPRARKTLDSIRALR